MARRSQRQVLPLGLAVAGLWLLASAWWPACPPLAATIAPGSPDLARLVTALARRDDACCRGDVAAFRAVVTAAYAEQLDHSLRRLGRRLDGSALRQFGERPLAASVEANCVGGRSAGDRAVVVARATGSVGGRGVFAVVLAGDGATWRLDHAEQQPTVDGGDAASVDDLTARLLGAR